MTWFRRNGSIIGDIRSWSDQRGIWGLFDAHQLKSSGNWGYVGQPQFNWRYYAFGDDIENTYIYWIQSDGTQSLLRTVSGEQHTNSGQPWDWYTEDLSSYSGTTGRIYIAYRTGGDYENDPQYDNMELLDTTSGDISLDPGTQAGRTRWQRRSAYTTTTAAPTSLTFSTIAIGESKDDVWNYDKGGTPSNQTGDNEDADGNSQGYYLYFEGSNPNNATENRYFWVRMTSDYTLL